MGLPPLPNGAGYLGAMAGDFVNSQYSGSFTTHSTGLPGNATFSGSGTVSGGGMTSGYANMSGLFVGPGASRAGLVYQFDTATATAPIGTVSGAAAFAKN